jgi:hypothetical protein
VSNSLAVAAVTATLQKLLFTGVSQDLAGTTVTARAPDRARVNSSGNQINLFLYQTGIEAAWRNEDMPGKVRPGEIGNPPMPLILRYLITAYSDTDDELNAHRLFGRVVSILHDHPRLEREELRFGFPGNDLHEQIERVHVTPQSLSVEELSKLWTTFQTPLRISAAYQACVVLIESTQPVWSAPPVLRRGEADRGPEAFTFIRPPFPEIEGAEFAGGQPGARPGAQFILRGQSLAADAVRAFLNGRRLDRQVELTATLPTDASVEIDLSASPAPLAPPPASLPAGSYTVTLVLTRAGHDLQLRPFSFAIAPAMVGLPATVARVNGVATIDLQCDPPLVPGQEAALIIAGRVIPARQVSPTSLQFAVPGLSVRDYFVRLRVDGIDSFLFDLDDPTPVYDETQKVTVSA